MDGNKLLNLKEPEEIQAAFNAEGLELSKDELASVAGGDFSINELLKKKGIKLRWVRKPLPGSFI